MKPCPRSFPNKKFRNILLRTGLLSITPRGPKLCAVFVILFVVWITYIASFCGDLLDLDCWRGERVSIVETSSLSNHYDPSVAGQEILVYDFAGVRSLKFGSIHNVRQATAVIGDPDIFTIPVLCHMAAAILCLPSGPPRRVLIFGMGGGALPAFVQKQFPAAHIDVVDLEPEVVRLALAHFNVRQTASLDVTIADGRRWVDALPAGGLPAAARYDIVVQACTSPRSRVICRLGSPRSDLITAWQGIADPAPPSTARD